MEHSDWLNSPALEYKNVPSQSERSLKLSNKNRLSESKTKILKHDVLGLKSLRKVTK